MVTAGEGDCRGCDCRGSDCLTGEKTDVIALAGEAIGRQCENKDLRWRTNCRRKEGFAYKLGESGCAIAGK